MSSLGDLLLQHQPGLDHDHIAVIQPADREGADDFVTNDLEAKGLNRGVTLGVDVTTITGVDERGDHTEILVIAKIAAVRGRRAPAGLEGDHAVLGRGVAVHHDLDLEGHDLAERHAIRCQGRDAGLGASRGIGVISVGDLGITIATAGDRVDIAGKGDRRDVVFGLGGAETDAVAAAGIGEGRGRVDASIAVVAGAGGAVVTEMDGARGQEEGLVQRIVGIDVPPGQDRAVGDAVQIALAAIGHIPGIMAVAGDAIAVVLGAFDPVRAGVERIVLGAVDAVLAGTVDMQDLKLHSAADLEAVGEKLRRTARRVVASIRRNSWVILAHGGVFVGSHWTNIPNFQLINHSQVSNVLDEYWEL